MKLLASILLAAVACTALLSPTGVRASEPKPDVPPLALALVEARYAENLLRLINEYRGQLGLAPLAMAEHLSDLAAEHSEHMTQSGRLSHESFRQRLGRSGSRLCVENVGIGYPYPKAQLNGWIGSPGHKRNLLEPNVRLAGVAVRDAYVTFFACS